MSHPENDGIPSPVRDFAEEERVEKAFDLNEPFEEEDDELTIDQEFDVEIELIDPEAAKDPAGVHEAMDRCSVFESMIHDHLLEHPSIKAHPVWSNHAEVACLTLADLYQRLGAEPDGYTLADADLVERLRVHAPVDQETKFLLTEAALALDNHRVLLAELYQVLGSHNVDPRVLDQVLAAIDGERLPYHSLLPYAPPEPGQGLHDADTLLDTQLGQENPGESLDHGQGEDGC